MGMGFCVREREKGDALRKLAHMANGNHGGKGYITKQKKRKTRSGEE